MGRFLSGGRQWRGGRDRSGDREDPPEAQLASAAKPPLGRRAREGRNDLRELPDAVERRGLKRGLRLRGLQSPRRHGKRILALLRQREELAGALPAGLPARVQTE